MHRVHKNIWKYMLSTCDIRNKLAYIYIYICTKLHFYYPISRYITHLYRFVYVSYMRGQAAFAPGVYSL